MKRYIYNQLKSWKLSKNRKPLIFKLYVLDVGLLGALTMAQPDQILIGNNVFSEYKGAFTENFVLQQLKSLPYLPIYYYSKPSSTQEYPFLHARFPRSRMDGKCTTIRC